ncbi:hypothetical protein HYPSUDRAFT_656476 [Hypholoma sublateritium FD-334 SS-4]|uniref:DUF6534 domain-containing protein n=1 Tax=Hypholoma sublateritium (strain FD-334 SS-4) TaxID=945553 RepID=A0A0D2L666_HYPSF|nr:hypothetical protein HYPSUDRAFT_656476 [Hypholoma sublateritium FD-334 SS-4]
MVLKVFRQTSINIMWRETHFENYSSYCYYCFVHRCILFRMRFCVKRTYSELNEVSFMLYASFGTAVLVDSLIAVSLCILLVRNRTGFKQTDSVVSRLMLFTINTGLLTSIAAVACFVTYAIWPQRFIFMGIYFALSKLYANSLLASLNARNVLRGQSWEDSGVLKSEAMTDIFQVSLAHRTLGSESP